MENLIYLKVHYCGEELNYEYAELDRSSMIGVIKDVIEKVHKRHKFNNESFMLTAIILWSGEKKELKTDIEFIDIVNTVQARKFDKLTL